MEVYDAASSLADALAFRLLLYSPQPLQRTVSVAPGHQLSSKLKHCSATKAHACPLRMCAPWHHDGYRSRVNQNSSSLVTVASECIQARAYVPACSTSTKTYLLAVLLPLFCCAPALGPVACEVLVGQRRRLLLAANKGAPNKAPWHHAKCAWQKVLDCRT